MKIQKKIESIQSLNPASATDLLACELLSLVVCYQWTSEECTGILDEHQNMNKHGLKHPSYCGYLIFPMTLQLLSCGSVMHSEDIMPVGTEM